MAAADNIECITLDDSFLVYHLVAWMQEDLEKERLEHQRLYKERIEAAKAKAARIPPSC